jgi:hypothetical protein
MNLRSSIPHQGESFMKNTLPRVIAIVLQLIATSIAVSAQPANQAPATPCKSTAELRQFDFWLGEWEVKSAQAENGPTVGRSRIESMVDGCVVLENWESQGFAGKSWNFYDRSVQKWRQIWVDVTGRRVEFSGSYQDNAMSFDGEVVLANGRRFKSRMKFFNLGPNKVRQFAERSTDDGKTWTTTVDLIYLRKA